MNPSDLFTNGGFTGGFAAHDIASRLILANEVHISSAQANLSQQGIKPQSSTCWLWPKNIAKSVEWMEGLKCSRWFKKAWIKSKKYEIYMTYGLNEQAYHSEIP